jgi:hypothetical protein
MPNARRLYALTRPLERTDEACSKPARRKPGPGESQQRSAPLRQFLIYDE